MTLLSQNSKMKKTGGEAYSVFNFGIPAFQSSDGTRTCPNAGKCAVGCYARQGAYMFGNVREAYEARFRLTKDAPAFTATMSEEIAKKLRTADGQGKTLVIRIHDSGDFYSREYFDLWVGIMQAFPKVLFYAYTKQVSMLQGVALPKNFRLNFSFGGKEDHLIDQKSSTSKVFRTRDELVKAGYEDTSHDDSYAFRGRGIRRIGLVYHGGKSFENTMWGKV